MPGQDFLRFITTHKFTVRLIPPGADESYYPQTGQQFYMHPTRSGLYELIPDKNLTPPAWNNSQFIFLNAGEEGDMRIEDDEEFPVPGIDQPRLYSILSLMGERFYVWFYEAPKPDQPGQNWLVCAARTVRDTPVRKAGGFGNDPD
ncbi:MAG: hypothetical protein KDI36_17610 [Pseudomonadales bacterium]|nr:hypothetical protein [Pseudomonadales bacterium]